MMVKKIVRLWKNHKLQSFYFADLSPRQGVAGSLAARGRRDTQYLKIINIVLVSLFLQGFGLSQTSKMATSLSIKAQELADQKSKYVASTLDTGSDENLIIHRDKFDCVTFVEYCLAHAVAVNLPDKPSLESCITMLRYRDGVIDGYGSRIHYFSEWIEQVENDGFGKDITADLGGEVSTKDINFMSTHLSIYPKLDNKALPQILSAEQKISSSARHIIPAVKVQSIESKLEEGDIVAFATTVRGLDYSHTGVVSIREDGTRVLLHASQDQGCVTYSKGSISAYLHAHPKMTGIAVLRIR